MISIILGFFDILYVHPHIEGSLQVTESKGRDFLGAPSGADYFGPESGHLLYCGLFFKSKYHLGRINTDHIEAPIRKLNLVPADCEVPFSLSGAGKI